MLRISIINKSLLSKLLLRMSTSPSPSRSGGLLREPLQDLRSVLAVGSNKKRFLKKL